MSKKALIVMLMGSLFLTSCSGAESGKTSSDMSSSSIQSSVSSTTAESATSSIIESTTSTSTGTASVTDDFDPNTLIPTTIESSPYISSTSISFNYTGSLEELKTFYKELGITGTETDKAPEGTGVAMSGQPYWGLDGTYKGKKISIAADEVESAAGKVCNVGIDF